MIWIEKLAIKGAWRLEKMFDSLEGKPVLNIEFIRGKISTHAYKKCLIIKNSCVICILMIHYTKDKKLL